MNAPPSREFHLIIEDWRVPGEAGSIAVSTTEPGNPPLVVRRGISRLHWQDHNVWRLEESAGHNSGGLPLIETIEARPLQPRLLMLSPTGYRANVNGIPAPRI